MEYTKDLSEWNDLGAQHINSHLEDYEVGRSGFFQLIIEFAEPLVKPDFALETPEESDYITNGSDVIRLSVDSVSVPHFQVDDISVERGNSVVHFAGKPKWNTGSMVCKDFVGLHTKEVLMAWQRLTYDPYTDRGGRGAEYKKKCTLIEYTHDHDEIRRWDLVGVFPTSIDEGNFDKSKGEEGREITVNFLYDRAFMHSADGETR